ncbi:hypothetical protein Sp245p_11560 [Azospirillum baldaniorum]|uniref:Uncharacterized protein n=2 Tax=Azospirillum baldaniorum TaxID=1064539 RepID=A0A9P1JPW8_9PROT|nr:hypothetical protein Sp245p_11560 [Azospirillum baldaniorum]TWA75248.1 hypothetical protein FBZ85_11273 [Azospirillum brasilense]CCC97494.1 conserved protein of unknown function [Azospirillum baldaniorum]
MWPMKRKEQETRNRAVQPPRVLLPSAVSEKMPMRSGRPPVPLRGAREARDAVTLARLLRGTITPLRGDEVLALLEPHRPRLVPKPVNPLAAMLGQPQGRLLEALLRPTAPIILDVLLPRLRDHLIDRVVHNKGTAEDGLPGALEVATALRALVALLRGAGRGAVLSVVSAIEADARADADRLVRGEAPVATAEDDPAGVAGGATAGAMDSLAHALLRFEARRLMLETLGATVALRDVVYQSRRLTRHALRRAAEAMDGFGADRGIKALHASLATLASVDGLLVVAMRNLDDQEEHREEANAFVEPADRKAMNDCLSAAWRLSDTLFDLVGKAANGGDLDELLFEALLRQLRSLHQFCTDLDHAGRPAVLDTLERRLAERSRALAGIAGERLVGILLARPADPAKARRLLARGQSLAQLLYDMGQDGDELEALALRLVVARDALNHAAA